MMILGVKNCDLKFHYNDVLKACESLALNKDQLLLAADNTKVQIEDSFNDILQALQNKKMQLLRQVDVFTTHQMHSLMSKQAMNTQILMGLKKLQKMSEGSDESHLLKEILGEEILSVLHEPQLSGKLKVNLNNTAVKQAISKWGAVEMNKVWPTCGENTVCCLPESPEEYEDEESHLFYKPVFNENSNINVSIPKLWDQGTEFWLLDKKKLNSLDNPSVRCWLSDIKGDSEPEHIRTHRFSLSSEGSDNSIEVIDVEETPHHMNKCSTKQELLTVEIENLDNLQCVRNKDKWLFQKTCNIKDFCIANELCNTYEDCLDGSNCYDAAVKSLASGVKRVETGNKNFSDWLIITGSQKMESDNDPELKSSFAHYFDNNNENWKPVKN